MKLQFVCYIHSVTSFKGEVIQVKEASYPFDGGGGMGRILRTPSVWTTFTFWSDNSSITQ